MSMVYQFYKACIKEGVKPIIGCEVYVVDDREQRQADKDKTNWHLVLIAKNKTGFKNLLRITSDAYENGFYSKPRTDHEMLEKYGEGIIALSACIGGEIPKMILEGMPEEDVINIIKFYQDIFDEFYLELQPGQFPEQIEVNAELIHLSEEYNVPLVITNDIHYLNKDDSFYHDCHVKTLQGKKLNEDMVYPDTCYYVMNSKELLEQFPAEQKNIILEAMENTVKITEKCDLNLSTDEIHMPAFDEEKDEDKLLEDLAFEKFDLIADCVPEPQRYIERMIYELSVIKELGFSGYFLSVHDFIRYAKENNIGVGPGRGSVGGSLIAYLLNITLADPIKYDLLFERFLSPHRKSIPDIDLDFDSTDRYKLFLYAKEKYGSDKTCKVSTIQRRKARGILDDVGRIMSLKEADIKKIKNCIPDVYYDNEGEKNAEIDLDFALKNIPELKRYEKQYPELFDIAKRLEGLPKNVSKHPAGILISTEPLKDYLPMRRKDEDLGISVTSLDLDDSEDLGFLKYDLLSLQTLNVIEKTMRETEVFDYLTNEFDDKKVWNLIGSRNSTGLFQISSPTYKKRMPKLKPKNIKELANCLALIRGPAISSGSDQLYIDIVNGKQDPIHIHDVYWEATKDTYGVLIYQESLMQLAVNYGLSLEDGYHIVKASAKKNFKKLESYKEKFYQNGAEMNIPKSVTDKIFNLIVQSGQYLFNSSHAVSYALLCYASAWLKTHYPLEFLKNLLTNAYTHKKEREVKEIYKELKTQKIAILPVDINKSSWEMTKEGDAIRVGFVALYNTGEKASNIISDNRPFESFDDFYQKISANRKDCNKKTIIALIMSGAFDEFEKDRVKLYRHFLSKEKKVDQEEMESNILKVTTNKFAHLDKGNKHLEQMFMGRPN